MLLLDVVISDSVVFIHLGAMAMVLQEEVSSEQNSHVSPLRTQCRASTCARDLQGIEGRQWAAPCQLSGP